MEPQAPVLDSGPDSGPGHAPESDAAPAVLADLIAAGLVSHEMIGDPARLGGEAACLRALCGLIAGPVYRIDAYHYAFRAEPGDLDGALAALAPGAWTGALETALTRALGPDAVWLNATDLLPEAGAALARPLLLLRAQAGAVTGALAEAPADLLAVINARYAADVARLTAATAPEAAAGGGDAIGKLAERLGVIETLADRLDAIETLADRLDAIEAGQAGIREGLAAGDGQGAAAVLAELTATLAQVLQRLDAQAEVIHSHVAREDQVAARLGEIADLAAGTGAFQETIGLTLAEFLARIERREAGAAPAPQLN